MMLYFMAPDCDAAPFIIFFYYRLFSSVTRFCARFSLFRPATNDSLTIIILTWESSEFIAVRFLMWEANFFYCCWVIFFNPVFFSFIGNTLQFTIHYAVHTVSDG